MITPKEISWSVLKRFLNKIIILDDNDCWEWQGARSKEGYGHFGVNGRILLTHRVMYVANSREDLSASLEVRHKCDNPPCCNPVHLTTGSHKQNMDDMTLKGRGIYPGRPKCLDSQRLMALKTMIAEKAGTYEELAEEFDISRSTVYRIARGRRRGRGG